MTKFAISLEGSESLLNLARQLIIEANSIISASKRLEMTISEQAHDLGIYSDAVINVAIKSRQELLSSKQDIENLSNRLQRRANEVAVLCSKALASCATSGSGSRSNSNLRYATNVPQKSRSESQMSSEGEMSRKIAFLPHTEQQIFSLENGNTIFNTPQVTGSRLNYDQGYGVPGFEGTCGIASCENVARLAGKDITEADVVTVASSNELCELGRPNAADNGGTTALDRQKILGLLGINSVVDDNLSVGHIADEVARGKGVIASVEVSKFWPNYTDQGLHAVTVTSVERDALGRPVAFYVCDSGYQGEHFARRIEAHVFERALSGNPLNVTSGSIR